MFRSSVKKSANVPIILRAWTTFGIMTLLAIGAAASGQQFNFRSFGTADGLPQPYIYSLVQDAEGYLWVGTGNGVSRFNGLVFENFSVDDSLADNFVSSVISDGKRVWFGHMNGNCSLYEGGKFRKISLPHSGGSPITHFAKNPGGDLWVSTYADGLYRLSYDTKSPQHFTFSEPGNIVTFAFSDSKEVLIGTLEGLFLCRLTSGGTIEIIRKVSGIPASRIADIEPFGLSFYVAMENEGIYMVLPDSRVIPVLGTSAATGSEITGIQDITVNDQTDLWIATFGNGLLWARHAEPGQEGMKRKVEPMAGLLSQDVKVITIDREGNLWAGNYGKGLTQILPQVFSVLKIENPSYGRSIFSIKNDHDYRWIGTDHGLLQTDRNSGRTLAFYGEPSLPDDTITALCFRNESDLWIGTGRHGTYRLNPGTGKIKRYPLAEGGLQNAVTSMDVNGNDVWVGTKNGLCRIRANADEACWYTIGQGGLPHNWINCVYTDRNGIVWITTHSRILACFKGEKLKKTHVFSGNGNQQLGPLTQDGMGRIWVGSMGNGVYRIEEDTVTRLTEKEGLFSNFCYSIYCDLSGNVWTGHKDGLSRIASGDFSVKPFSQVINRPEPVKFLPLALDEDQQGILWFGTDRGLVRYDPNMESGWEVPPVLSLSSININGEEWPVTERIVLRPGNYRIRIDFIGISLEDPERVSYQYQLEGYDQFPEITKVRHITYNHLTEGKYAFTLWASNSNGDITPVPLSLQIVIKTPVWKKAWFYLLILLGAGIFTYLYIRRREFNHQAEKRILEEKVEERTREIQRQRDAMAQQRDMIRQKNVSITSSINYASHIQEAILPSLEMINQLLPENFIYSKPRAIVSGDFYWAAESNEKVVFAVGDCTGHGVPGAFLSILGITLLNELVNIEGITRSDILIGRFLQKLNHALRHSGNDNMATDGIDIALCVIDRHEQRLQYTGAMNDLVLVRNSQLDVLQANRITLSSGDTGSEVFTLQEFKYQKGDMIYLYSDGYPDQFGGPRDKKFSYRRMKAIFLEVASKPMEEQRQILAQNLGEWMKGYTQTDDITVMGVRL